MRDRMVGGCSGMANENNRRMIAAKNTGVMSRYFAEKSTLKLWVRRLKTDLTHDVLDGDARFIQQPLQGLSCGGVFPQGLVHHE